MVTDDQAVIQPVNKSEQILKQLTGLKEGELVTLGEVLIDGKKMKNSYLRKLVKNMQNKNAKPGTIITALLAIDELIEKGNISKDMVSSLAENK